MMYNPYMASFSRCTHLSLRNPTYMRLYPLKHTSMTSRIVRQTLYDSTLSCGFAQLKPTYSFLYSLFSLTWYLDGIPSPPIQDLLESQSFVIQYSKQNSFSALENIKFHQVSSPSPYICFYNLELWPNSNL